MEELKDRLSEFVKHNAGASLAKGNEMSISEMSEAVKQLPEYR